MAGITAGIACNVMGKSIDETVPLEVQGQFGTLLNAYICIGFPISYGLGAILPTDEDLMAEDERWRIIYGVPALIAIIQISLFLLVIRQEPVAFSIAEGKEEEAKALLRRVYKSGGVEDFEARIDKQYLILSQTTAKDTSKISFKDAICGAKYRKATWICVLLFSF